MIAKLTFNSLQLVLLWSSISFEGTAMQLPARFDAGPVNSCEIPAANFCLVNYSVPTSVASLTLVIEEEIRNLYKIDKDNGLECARALRDIRCAQRFPRCSEDSTEVTLSSLNCTEMISVCPSNILMMLQEEGFCTLSGTTVIGECQPVTEYGYQFQQCPIMGSSDSGISSWYVTRWMYDIMVHTDVQLTAYFNGTLRNTNPECRRRYATYFCQFMGRCTSDEEPQVEVVNTYEMCEEVINCFPDWLASTLREILACSLWPNQLGSLVPTFSPLPVPVTTDLTTEPPSGSSSSSDDSTQRTAATVKFTLQNPTINTYAGFGSSASGDDSTLGTATRTTGPFSTITDPKDMFPTGVASVCSACLWTSLLLTTLAIMGGL